MANIYYKSTLCSRKLSTTVADCYNWIIRNVFHNRLAIYNSYRFVHFLRAANYFQLTVDSVVDKMSS